jgi:hypothetical protein
MKNISELPELLNGGINSNLLPCLESGRCHYIYQFHKKGATALIWQQGRSFRQSLGGAAREFF